MIASIGLDGEINTHTIAEQICGTTPEIYPVLKINDATFSASNNRAAALRLENCGDCVLEVELRQRDF